MRQLESCPVSGDNLIGGPANLEIITDIPGFTVDCSHCGSFQIDSIGLNHALYHTGHTSSAEIPLKVARRRTAVIAYALKRMGSSHETPLLTAEIIERIVAEDRLPNLAEQSDNLLRYLGDNLQPGTNYLLLYREIGAIIGCPDEGVYSLLVEGMIARGLLAGTPGQFRLTYGSLAKLEELQRGTPSGYNAFMAMQFGDKRLDYLVDKYFRPAVEKTGFKLYRLDDHPEAGLIDIRLRNEIRNSRFLLVDLSHANAGAYWEAGYAEGLGKPVIYTCERAVF